ncbi:hypothetical protein ACHAPG_006637 [Botrytis cinerea]
MNWAIIIREDRLYKGKTLYRWDASPGLEHHCGTCATPLHRKSHECLGCNMSDEMHYTRHREILAIVRQLNTLDQTDLSLGSQMSKKKSEYDKKRTDSETTSEATDAISEMSLEEENLTKRERKRAKKSKAKTRRIIDVYSQDEINCISEALHGQIHESKGAWEGTYAYDNRHLDASSASAGTVGEEDEECDEYAVQPPTQASNKEYKTPNYPTPKQQKAAKKLTTVTPLKQPKRRGNQQKFTPETAYKNDPYGGVNPQIFYRLGIDVKPPSNPKIRKELIGKLIAAINNDLHVIRREEEEAVIREEGFWRWAGRNAFRNIREYREKFDWATGQKITPGQKMIAMKTEAELFGDEPENYQIDDETEEASRQDSPESEGEVSMDEGISARMMVEWKDTKEVANGSEDKFVDEKEQKIKKLKVLRITTAHESHIRPKAGLYKSISKTPLGKIKQGSKRFETEGFVDFSVEGDDEMEHEGIDDLVRYRTYGSNKLKSTSSTWANVVGYSSNDTTSTAKKGKKVITDKTITPPPIEDDEWTTVTRKRGSKK